MPMEVIDPSKLVKIAEEYCQRLFIPSGSRNLLFNPVVKIPAVVKVCKGISYGLIGQRLFRKFTLRDIPDDSKAADDLA